MTTELYFIIVFIVAIIWGIILTATSLWKEGDGAMLCLAIIMSVGWPILIIILGSILICSIPFGIGFGLVKLYKKISFNFIGENMEETDNLWKFILLNQEVRWWINNPEDFTEENLKFISERRGFDKGDIKLIKEKLSSWNITIKP